MSMTDDFDATMDRLERAQTTRERGRAQTRQARQSFGQSAVGNLIDQGSPLTMEHPVPRYEDLGRIQQEEEARASGERASRDYSPLPDQLGIFVPPATIVGDLGGAVADTAQGALGDEPARLRQRERAQRWHAGTEQAGRDVLSEGGAGEIIDAVAGMPRAMREEDDARDLRGERPLGIGDRLYGMWTSWPQAGRQARADTAAADSAADYEAVDRVQRQDRGEQAFSQAETVLRNQQSRAAGGDFWTTAPAAAEFIPGFGLTSSAGGLGRRLITQAPHEIPEVVGPLTQGGRNLRNRTVLGAGVGAYAADASNGSVGDQDTQRGIGGAILGGLVAARAPSVVNAVRRVGMRSEAVAAAELADATPETVPSSSAAMSGRRIGEGAESGPSGEPLAPAALPRTEPPSPYDMTDLGRAVNRGLTESDQDFLGMMAREDIPTPEEALGRPLTPDHIWNDPRFRHRQAMTPDLEGVQTPEERFNTAGERVDSSVANARTEARPFVRIERLSGPGPSRYALHHPTGGGEFHPTMRSAQESAQAQGWDPILPDMPEMPPSLRGSTAERIARQRQITASNEAEAQQIATEQGLENPPDMAGIPDYLAGWPGRGLNKSGFMDDAGRVDQGRFTQSLLEGELGPYRIGGPYQDVPLLGTPDIAADPLANSTRAGLSRNTQPPWMRTPNEDARWPLFGRVSPEAPRTPPGAGAVQQSADLDHVRYWVERYGGGAEGEAKAIRDYTDDLSQAGWRRQQDLRARIAAIQDGSYRRGAPNNLSPRVEEAFPELYRPSSRAPDGNTSAGVQAPRETGFTDEPVRGRGSTRILSNNDGSGALTYNAYPNGVWQVRESGLDAAQRGKGRGVALYEELLRRAREAGVREIVSDTTLTQDALHVYDALQRRGYAQVRDAALSRPLGGMGNYTSSESLGRPLIRIQTTPDGGAGAGVQSFALSARSTEAGVTGPEEALRQAFDRSGVSRPQNVTLRATRLRPDELPDIGSSWRDRDKMAYYEDRLSQSEPPPIVVARDARNGQWDVIDGNHRLEVMRRAGRSDILVLDATEAFGGHYVSPDAIPPTPIRPRGQAPARGDALGARELALPQSVTLTGRDRGASGLARYRYAPPEAPRGTTWDFVVEPDAGSAEGLASVQMQLKHNGQNVPIERALGEASPEEAFTIYRALQETLVADARANNRPGYYITGLGRLQGLHEQMAARAQRLGLLPEGYRYIPGEGRQSARIVRDTGASVPQARTPPNGSATGAIGGAIGGGAVGAALSGDAEASNGEGGGGMPLLPVLAAGGIGALLGARGARSSVGAGGRPFGYDFESAVRRLRSGEPTNAVAADIGINVESLERAVNRRIADGAIEPFPMTRGFRRGRTPTVAIEEIDRLLRDERLGYTETGRRVGLDASAVRKRHDAAVARGEVAPLEARPSAGARGLQGSYDEADFINSVLARDEQHRLPSLDAVTQDLRGDMATHGDLKTIRQQFYHLRQQAIAAVRTGENDINTLAEQWHVTPERLIEFANSANESRGFAAIREALKIVESGVTDTQTIARELRSRADLAGADLRDNSLMVTISKARAQHRINLARETEGEFSQTVNSEQAANRRRTDTASAIGTIGTVAAGGIGAGLLLNGGEAHAEEVGNIRPLPQGYDPSQGEWMEPSWVRLPGDGSVYARTRLSPDGHSVHRIVARSDQTGLHYIGELPISDAPLPENYGRRWQPPEASPEAQDSTPSEVDSAVTETPAPRAIGQPEDQAANARGRGIVAPMIVGALASLATRGALRRATPLAREALSLGAGGIGGAVGSTFTGDDPGQGAVIGAGAGLGSSMLWRGGARMQAAERLGLSSPPRFSEDMVMRPDIPQGAPIAVEEGREIQRRLGSLNDGNPLTSGETRRIGEPATLAQQFTDPETGSSVFGEPKRPRSPPTPLAPLEERVAQAGPQGGMQRVPMAKMRQIAEDLDIPSEGRTAPDLRRAIVRELATDARFERRQALVAFLQRYGLTMAGLGLIEGGLISSGQNAEAHAP